MKGKITVQAHYFDLEKLEKYPNNPRTITEKSLEDLCNSIAEDPLYFETRPIICSDRTGMPVIIAGEKRYFAALMLGLKTAPVAIIPNLTEADEQRILVKDNGSFGEWDYDMLQDLGWELSNAAKWGANIDFSKFTDTDEKSIVGNDYEATAHLQYLAFDNYKIPLSEIEIEKLNAAIDNYMAENGTLIGFVNSLFACDE